jgi:hypothetical protein
MFSYSDSADNLSARRNVDVPSDHRRTGFAACSYGNLLKNNAVGTNSRVRMDNNPVRMRYQQSAADRDIQWDFRPRYCRPKAMLQNVPLSADEADWSAARPVVLISPNGTQ